MVVFTRNREAQSVLMARGSLLCLVIACLQRHEVPIVHREVQSYFSKDLILAPGDTVFDVGANIGLFALEVYERCLGNVRLYAFEPVAAIFDVEYDEMVIVLPSTFTAAATATIGHWCATRTNFS